jgi:hypothetical protein
VLIGLSRWYLVMLRDAREYGLLLDDASCDNSTYDLRAAGLGLITDRKAGTNSIANERQEIYPMDHVQLLMQFFEALSSTIHVTC